MFRRQSHSGLLLYSLKINIKAVGKGVATCRIPLLFLVSVFGIYQRNRRVAIARSSYSTYQTRSIVQRSGRIDKQQLRWPTVCSINCKVNAKQGQNTDGKQRYRVFQRFLCKTNMAWQLVKAWGIQPTRNGFISKHGSSYICVIRKFLMFHFS